MLGRTLYIALVACTLSLITSAYPQPNTVTPQCPYSSQTYSYIIVGGGPSGFVLANRLSEDPSVSILLLEAGPDSSNVEDVYIPGFAGVNEFSPQAWNYYNVPQETLNGATPHLAQGYGFGGGTSINYMNYNRGAKSVFDQWANVSGNDGLAWRNLLQDFKATAQLDKNNVPSNFSQVLDMEDYGNGPLSLTRALTLDGFDPSWNQALLATFNISEVDFNSGVGIGVSYGVESIEPSNRTRSYAYPAFGFPIAGRPNVRLVHGTYVGKINFAGTRATSVNYIDTDHGNITCTVAAREIIVSAGAIGSPKLLMLSGVGPQDHLESLGIPVILDSPQVGSNLRDHNYASIEIQVTDAVYTLSEWQNTTYLADIKQQFYDQHSGPLANAPASSFAILRVPDSALPSGPAGAFQRNLPADRGQIQLQYANIALVPNTSAADTKIMTLWAALVQPEASGTVRLASSNPMDYPLIDTNYFGSPGDMAAVLWGYKQLRSVLHSDLLKPLIVKEVYPGANVTSDADLMTAIKGAAQSYHHPQGTCSLGTVLDSGWRVKGLQGLRVVDSSVFPYPPNVHMQAQVYAVAHVAARQIAAVDWGKGGW